jgi:hypothetical protein
MINDLVVVVVVVVVAAVVVVMTIEPQEKEPTPTGCQLVYPTSCQRAGE